MRASRAKVAGSHDTPTTSGTLLAASKIAVVVAVSCNVTTFARDAKILIDGGYKIDSVTPVDQFRHTPHVELVARFRR